MRKNLTQTNIATSPAEGRRDNTGERTANLKHAINVDDSSERNHNETDRLSKVAKSPLNEGGDERQKFANEKREHRENVYHALDYRSHSLNTKRDRRSSHGTLQLRGHFTARISQSDSSDNPDSTHAHILPIQPLADM